MNKQAFILKLKDNILGHLLKKDYDRDIYSDLQNHCNVWLFFSPFEIVHNCVNILLSYSEIICTIVSWLQNKP